MTSKDLSEKLNEISAKLQSHLEVAQFVDKSSKKDIETISDDLKNLTTRVKDVETKVELIERDKKSKKEVFIFIVKVITLVCVILGAISTIYTLTRMGINGTSTN